MDPYSEHVTEYLTNFTGFASNFTKAFIPIVDTAIKMSSGEPVSAYSVFKAAKDMADANKKSKKRQYSTKKGTNAKSTNKGRIKKLACAPSENSTKAMGKNNKLNVSAQTKTPLATKNNTKHEVNKIKNDSGKKSNEAEVTRKGNDPKLKGFEEVNILDNLYKNDGKKLSKSSKKREKDLGDSAKELKKDNNTLGEEDESFDNGGFDGEGNEEKSHSDIEIYSDEYTVGESDSYSERETAAHYTDEESSSTNEEDNQAAEALAQAILAKSSKKRKSPKTKNNLTNGISESKKLKKSEETRTASYKRFPADKSGRRHCSSLASEDDSTKRFVPSISSHADKPEKHVEETNDRRSPLASIGDITKKSTPKVVVNKITAANIKLEPLSPPSNLIKLNSIEEGKRVFTWLLNPLTVDDFFNKYWEQKACLIKRQQDNYFTHLISFEAIDKMLLKNHVEFTKNIDITSYKNDIRETLNPEGRALPPIVWDHYGQGCSIRLLNPQTFLPSLFTLSTTLQEYFHCLVGFNVYITPPNSQGFAPHYDDIEAFILQIEGRKRWKLYKPRKTSEILPRYSSENFTQQEIGKPVFEEVLEPGDVLYFPRGTIHQACTEPGYHSLHITLSVYQKQSYADLFEKMLPLMLQKFIATNVDVRRGLPLNAWQHAGIAFSNNTTKERADLIKKVAQLMQKFMCDLPLKDIMDMAIDQIAKKFQHEALPPEVLPAEKLRTVFGSRSRANELGECVCDYDIDERTNVRLLRANILRLVEEEEKIRIYYYLDNSKEYCAYEPNFIEIEATEAASIEILIKSYPQYVGVSQLPLPSDEEKITLVTALWERGLLMMEKPFK